ncbi:hypothetical protein EVAR_2558_1 [Eumeta japonica]|uniref:Uncharacterized protein n=1 Tax=Eumeta variegata TaxID=151549 RepID=A0A4C1SLN8_EUMVA|nr:hypothetical protein EVAR_2558_1 [Eumeta japonica]
MIHSPGIRSQCFYLKSAWRGQDHRPRWSGADLKLLTFVVSHDMVPSHDMLQATVTKMSDSVKKRDTTVSKTEIVVFERNESTTEYEICIGGERDESTKECIYFERSGVRVNDNDYDRREKERK